jgi:hypothetical protein
MSMNIIRSIKIVFLSLFLSASLFGQTILEVIPTGGLDKSTASELDFLLKKLNKGKSGNKAKFAFLITNIYNLNDDKIIVKADDPILNQNKCFKTSQNFIFKSKSDLNEGILEYIKQEDWNQFYSSKFNSLNNEKIHNFNNLENLVSEAQKKSKKKAVKIIYDNGFIDPAYSKERLENFINNRQSNCSDLHPKFTKIKDRYQLRPEGYYYIIEFDTVGFFDSYEVEIFRNSEGSKKVLINDVFSVKSTEQSDDYYIKIVSKSKNAKLYLKESYLGLNCVNNIRKENIVGKGWDPLCGECQNECLYQTNFNIRIRGIAEGFTDDCLWTDEVKKIEFQCTTK